MKTVDTLVTDKDGSQVPAKLIVCPQCNESKFFIYVIGEKHQHLQCTWCEATFCDGKCQNAKV